MKLRLLLCTMVIATVSIPVLSDDSGVDGSAILAWWSNDFSADALDASFDVGTVGAEAEVWWSQKWGIKGSFLKSDVLESNSGEGPDFLSVDLKRRVISPTKNNFLALGLGWERVDLGKRADTRGPRFLLQGGLGLTPVLAVYGHAAWLPIMDDSEELQDPKGFEFEAGIAINPFPHVLLRAGYRQFDLDFESLDGGDETSTSRGLILGAGVEF